jgi:hypothetical protein
MSGRGPGRGSIVHFGWHYSSPRVGPESGGDDSRPDSASRRESDGVGVGGGRAEGSGGIAVAAPKIRRCPRRCE